MKSTWSDEESKGSQEEDNLVSNQVAFSGSLVSDNFVFMQGRAGISTESVCLSAKSGFVALENKSATNSDYGSESDCGDKSEKDDEFYIRRMRRCIHNDLKFVPQTIP